MKVCLILALVMNVASAFLSTPSRPMQTCLRLSATPGKVEVCGFKDCRRAGGGKRLENLVNSVRFESFYEYARSIRLSRCVFTFRVIRLWKKRA